MQGEAVQTVNELLEAQGWQSGSFPLQASPMQLRLLFTPMSPNEVNNMTLQKAGLQQHLLFCWRRAKWFIERPDSLNYVDSLMHYGFSIGMESLGSADHSKRIGYLRRRPSRKAEGRDDFLPNATAEALECFAQSEEPFFLMVEGSQID